MVARSTLRVCLTFILVCFLPPGQFSLSAWSAPTQSASRTKTGQSDPYSIAAKKLDKRISALKAELAGLTRQYDTLDYQIKSMEKQWLGVGIPSGLAPKYNRLVSAQARVCQRAEDIGNRMSGVVIEVGDDLRRNELFYAAESMYLKVLEIRSPGYSGDTNPAFEKAVGRLVSLYSMRARAYDGRQDYQSSSIYWSKIVDLLGTDDPKCAEANAGLAACKEWERKKAEIAATISEPSLAGLKLGDPISKAKETYGDIYATGPQVLATQNKPELTSSLPRFVYYSAKHCAWLLIWAAPSRTPVGEPGIEYIPGDRPRIIFKPDTPEPPQPEDSIEHIRIDREPLLANKFTKDCGLDFAGIHTNRGVMVGDPIEKAVASYGSHESPKDGYIYYATGDSYTAFDGPRRGGYIEFWYDTKTRKITAINIGTSDSPPPTD